MLWMYTWTITLMVFTIHISLVFLFQIYILIIMNSHPKKTTHTKLLGVSSGYYVEYLKVFNLKHWLRFFSHKYFYSIIITFKFFDINCLKHSANDLIFLSNRNNDCENNAWKIVITILL